MQVIAPGDPRYEAIIKGILARLDERERKRRETPKFIRWKAELEGLEAESLTGQSGKTSKLTDDQVFAEQQRQKKCAALRTKIEHHLDDVHQAEQKHKAHRKQFEDALERHRLIVAQQQT